MKIGTHTLRTLSLVEFKHGSSRSQGHGDAEVKSRKYKSDTDFLGENCVLFSRYLSIHPRPQRHAP